MRIWVIGAGGLFGSALVRQARSLGHVVRASTGVPWVDSARARSYLRAEAGMFLQDQHAGGEPWGICWAAGRVTTTSSREEADQELALFRDFVSDLQALLEETPESSPGAFLLTSSAGGAYAESDPAPFDSSTPPRPLGPYGELKVAQEECAIRHLAPHLRVTIARVANLYGPGQDLGKLQGLISRLALAAVTREPVTIFVPPDTLRDYIYVDDAAARALHWLTAPASVGSHVRVIASGDALSLGRLIALVQDITHVRFPVAYGLHASAVSQARDMRLAPDVDEEITALPRTPLPDGIKRVHLDILERIQQGTATAV